VLSFKDRELAKTILEKIKSGGKKLNFMHVCGTHQDTLVKHGLDVLFESRGINICQGPGCPVCVTTPLEIEECILLANNGKIIASFGDMMRVPGDSGSLQDMKAEGCDIRTVYGIEDAVNIAIKNPSKEVVFMAVGFETTAPTTSTVILNQPPENFSILCCHRTIPPALNAILEMGELKLDGFIEPGHVSTIIGTKPYEFISRDYKIPQVISGFEPIDLLMTAWMLIKQIDEEDAKVENEYTRAVDEQGNLKAQSVMKETFCPVDKRWRGFPIIKKSGLELRSKFDQFNSRKIFEDELEYLKNKEYLEPPGCRCGELLRGLINPQDCSLFGKGCTPDKPIGPCMVSIEGSCNIAYRYKGKIKIPYG